MGDNGTHDSLSYRQKRFLAALLEAPTVRDAAETAQVSETSAWRWLADVDVRAALHERTDALLSQAAAGLLTDLSLARQTLRGVMQSQGASDAAKVSAARAVLDGSLRLFELVALSERVAELEKRMEGESYEELESTP